MSNINITRNPASNEDDRTWMTVDSGDVIVTVDSVSIRWTSGGERRTEWDMAIPNKVLTEIVSAVVRRATTPSIDRAEVMSIGVLTERIKAEDLAILNFDFDKYTLAVLNEEVAP